MHLCHGCRHKSFNKTGIGSTSIQNTPHSCHAMPSTSNISRTGRKPAYFRRAVLPTSQQGSCGIFFFLCTCPPHAPCCSSVALLLCTHNGRPAIPAPAVEGTDHCCLLRLHDRCPSRTWAVISTRHVIANITVALRDSRMHVWCSTGIRRIWNDVSGIL